MKEAVTAEELDSTLRSKISKIEDGFKKLFSLSKSIIKKSENADEVQSDGLDTAADSGSLSKDDEAIAQQMSGKMIDYFNKVKTSSSKVKKALAEVTDFDFDIGSDDKIKPVEDWLQGMKSKLDAAGGEHNRKAIFDKVKSDIKQKSPEAYEYFFNESNTQSPAPESTSPNDTQEGQPKKDPNKELNINENKLFSTIDFHSYKFAVDEVAGTQSSGEESSGGKDNQVNPNKDKEEKENKIKEHTEKLVKSLYLTQDILSSLEVSVKSYLAKINLRSKVGEILKDLPTFVVNSTSLKPPVDNAAKSAYKYISEKIPNGKQKIVFDMLPNVFESVSKLIPDDLIIDIEKSSNEDIKHFISTNDIYVKPILEKVVLAVLKSVHSATKANYSKLAITSVLSDIYKKFAQLTTKITGSYDLEDVVAAMLIGGEKDKFFEHVYSYITNTMDSDVRTASDVMDKILDDTSSDPDLLRKYFQAYTEGVDCLLTEFVNSIGIPAATVADALGSNYISQENMEKMSAGIKEFVERGATLEEQRAIKQFIDQYQISPELAYKLVCAESSGEFIRMSAGIMLRELFANVSDSDIELMAADEVTISSIATHINDQIQKLDNKYSLSEMTIEKFGTINITIVDENGGKKEVSNKDEEFDLDLSADEPETDAESDSEDAGGTDLNAEIDKAVKESESISSGGEGDIFTSDTAEEPKADQEPVAKEEPAAEPAKEPSRLEKAFL